MKNLKKFIEPLLRSGNPDLTFLGTLKIKIQIYRFLNIPSKNRGFKLIFRVDNYLKKGHSEVYDISQFDIFLECKISKCSKLPDFQFVQNDTISIYSYFQNSRISNNET